MAPTLRKTPARVAYAAKRRAAPRVFSKNDPNTRVIAYYLRFSAHMSQRLGHHDSDAAAFRNALNSIKVEMRKLPLEMRASLVDELPECTWCKAGADDKEKCACTEHARRLVTSAQTEADEA